jgi:hypothetical protein
VDVKQVGRELGVRYLLEGSVRKSANRIRIAGQLIDTSSGAHLWADRFEGAIEDVFELQDRVTARVVGVIAPRLQQAEIERARRKPTESLDAYDLYLRGLANVSKWTREGNDKALSLFYQAIERIPLRVGVCPSADCLTHPRRLDEHRLRRRLPSKRLAHARSDWVATMLACLLRGMGAHSVCKELMMVPTS